MKIIITFILILILLRHKTNYKTKKMILTSSCFIILLFTCYLFKNEQIVSNKIEYMTLLTHYYPKDSMNTGDYIPALKATIPDLIKSGTIKANEYGWYFYIKGDKQYLMVATATNEFYKTSSHYQKIGRINGLNYRNYKDTFVIEIDGRKYNAMVLDSCGECMKAKYAKEEKIDVLTVRKPKIVPDGLQANVISSGSNNNYNPNTLIDVNDNYFANATDYNPGTNYTGDLINGYLYNRLIKEKPLGSKLTDQNILDSLTNSIDDMISEIYNRVVIGLLYNGTNTGEYGNFEAIGNIEAGEASTWKQCNSSWGSIRLGNSKATICSAGCLATSVAIQIERSGVTLSSSFNTKLNPGSFVQYMNQKGGFDSGGNWYWAKTTEVAPNFKYVDKDKQINRANILSKVSSYLSKGYYIVVHVSGSKNHNTSNHWVAITGVTDNDILIVDPAGRGTSLDSAYGLKYADQIGIYKVS